MAQKQETTLLSCPLEIRHEIFGYVCEREEGSKNLLRNWFGRRELKENAASAPPQPELDEDEGDDADNDGEEEDAEDEDEDEDMDDDAGDDEDDEDADGNGDGSPATANATATATATVAPPAPPQISRKWRHVPNIMSLTACPPPLNLLSTCQQLNYEATDYYYDIVTLRINCTSGFGHMAYFEELMDMLSKTAFSPAESVRKVELTFVWDSQWLRASDTFSEIFVALLRQRAHLVSDVLTQTPGLKELRVVWHDSVQDNDSKLLQESVMEEFYGLMDRAELKLEEHYDLKGGEEPEEESVLGQMRLQFEEVMQSFAAGRAF